MLPHTHTRLTTYRPLELDTSRLFCSVFKQRNPNWKNLYAPADRGGPPPCPNIFLKIMQFSGKGNPSLWGPFGFSSPVFGIKTTLGPLTKLLDPPLVWMPSCWYLRSFPMRLFRNTICTKLNKGAYQRWSRTREKASLCVFNFRFVMEIEMTSKRQMSPPLTGLWQRQQQHHDSDKPLASRAA